MDDREFEFGLERLFGQAPALADAEAFARRVDGKLGRSWRLRTTVLGLAGAAGGALALGQLASSDMIPQLRRLSATAVGSAGLADHAYHRLWGQAQDLMGATPGMGLFWAASAVIVGLAAVAGLRVFEDA